MAKKTTTLRVHTLAKESVSSKDIITKCQAEDIPDITNHMSAVSSVCRTPFESGSAAAGGVDHGGGDRHRWMSRRREKKVKKAAKEAKAKAKPKPEPEPAPETTTEPTVVAEASKSPASAAAIAPRPRPVGPVRPDEVATPPPAGDARPRPRSRRMTCPIAPRWAAGQVLEQPKKVRSAARRYSRGGADPVRPRPARPRGRDDDQRGPAGAVAPRWHDGFGAVMDGWGRGWPGNKPGVLSQRGATGRPGRGPPTLPALAGPGHARTRPGSSTPRFLPSHRQDNRGAWAVVASRTSRRSRRDPSRSRSRSRSRTFRRRRASRGRTSSRSSSSRGRRPPSTPRSRPIRRSRS